MSHLEIIHNLGKEHLFVGGYFYVKKTWNAKTIKWGCAHRRTMDCKGSVTTSNKYPYRNPFDFLEHSHPPNVILRKEKIKLVGKTVSMDNFSPLSTTALGSVENAVNKQSIGNVNNKEKATEKDKIALTGLAKELVYVPVKKTTNDLDSLITVTARKPHITLTRIIKNGNNLPRIEEDENLSLTKSSSDVTYGRHIITTRTSTATTASTTLSVTTASLTTVSVTTSTSTVMTPTTNTSSFLSLSPPNNSTTVKEEPEDVPEIVADIMDLTNISLPEPGIQQNQEVRDVQDAIRKQFVTHVSLENTNHYNKKRKLNSNSTLGKDRNHDENCALEGQEPQRAGLTELLDRAELLDLNVRNILTEDIHNFCNLNPIDSDQHLARPNEPISARSVEQLDLEQKLRIFYLKTIFRKEDELMDLKLEMNRIQIAKDKMEIDHKKEAHLLRMENMNLEKKFWKLRMQLMAD